MKYKELLGEFLGTFILVFVGCSSIILAVIFEWMQLTGVAITWGIGVIIAIYTVKSFSHAHLNPAVSISMVVAKKIDGKSFIKYSIVQTIGAFLAVGLMYLIFSGDIFAYEMSKGLVRGEQGSEVTAQFFGEFYPNPSYTIDIHWPIAALIEFGGTLLLVLVIFLLDKAPKFLHKFAPIIIGGTVTTVILLIAPYTQAGINPARDFGPRVFAYLGGWRDIAFPRENFGFLTVYILAPLLAGVLVAILFNSIGKRKQSDVINP